MTRQVLTLFAAAGVLAGCGSATAPEVAAPAAATMNEAAGDSTARRSGNGFGSGYRTTSSGDGTQTTAVGDSTTSRVGNGFGSGY
jgi:hypothetical protein